MAKGGNDKKLAAHQQGRLANGDQSPNRGETQQQQSSNMSGHCKLPLAGPDSPGADSLRALKQALSLRMGAQAGCLRAPPEPAMPVVACQQVMGFQSLSSVAGIQESTTVQHLQQRSKDTQEYIELPMKRSRLTHCSDCEKEVCLAAHALTQRVLHKCDRVQKKQNKVDKNQALYPVNRIEESTIQSGLPTEGASLQEESVKVELPNLEKMTAMQDKAQDLALLHLSDGKKYSNIQCGPSRDTFLSFETQPPFRNNTEEAVIVPSKVKKRGEKKAKKRPLPCNTKEEEAAALSGLLDEVAPHQVLVAPRKEVIVEVERAAAEAHSKLLAEGEAVTVAKVVFNLLRDSNSVSLESLGLCMHEIPHLHRLAYLEERVNTLILCHLAARKITTLHDLHQEILTMEKVKNFRKLRIGHLSLHPLVVQHFAPSSGFKIHSITASDVLNYLWDYLDIDTHQNPSKVQLDDFLDFMAKARALSSSDQLCVRIQSLKMYASYLLREKKAAVKLLNRVCKVNGPNIKIAQKRGLTNHCHSTQSRIIQQSKHVVYLSSDEEDDNKHKWGELGGKKEEFLTSDRRPDKRCVYPSAAEERLRLIGKVPSQLQQELTECELSVQEIQAIVTAWSDVCSGFSIKEVLIQMVTENELEQEKSKKKLMTLFKCHSATTILNIVVKSIKAGLWKSVFNTEKGPINDEIFNNGTPKSSNKETFLRGSAEQPDIEELGFSTFKSGSDVTELEALLTWQGMGPCSDLGKEWRFKSSSEYKSQVETQFLKHSADHHAKENESQPVQDKFSGDLTNNRTDDKYHGFAVETRSLKHSADHHAKEKESNKLSGDLANNRTDDKCHGSAVETRSLKHSADHHAKENESKPVQDKLSGDLANNRMDDKCHGSAVETRSLKHSADHHAKENESKPVQGKLSGDLANNRTDDKCHGCAVETRSLKHSADHHAKENESKPVQGKLSGDLADNRTDGKCDGSAVENVAVCKRSRPAMMNQSGAEHVKEKETKQVQEKLSRDLANNKTDDKCHGSMVDDVAVCKKSLAAMMNQVGLEQNAKLKDSKQHEDDLSGDLASKRTDDSKQQNSSAVDSIVVCKRSHAALMNEGGALQLELMGKRFRRSSTTEVAPPVIKAGLGHSGKNSEGLKHADDVVVPQADPGGTKGCELDPCKNKIDKLQRPRVITNFPSNSSLVGLKVHRGTGDKNTQFVSLSSKDKTFFGDPCKSQAFLTGRLSEAVVFNHLMDKYGPNRVLWINEEMERGLPYDIAVEEYDGQQLHVEVKATWAENSDWFEISNREWEFAAQAGDKFIIARVFFSGPSGSARFVWLRNPVKLCRDKRVRLALIVPS